MAGHEARFGFRSVPGPRRGCAGPPGEGGERMRGLLGCAATGLVLASAAGCSRSAPTPAGGGPPAPASGAPAAEGKRPKFESELVATHTLNGGTGSSAHRSTRYDDGKLFTAVENYATTIKGGPVTLKYEVAFVAHRDGKDVFRLT